MKRFKKFISLMLIIMLVVSMIPQTAFARTNNGNGHFKDDDWKDDDWKDDDSSSSKKTYTHIDMAVVITDEDGNYQGWYLASAPTVYANNVIGKNGIVSNVKISYSEKATQSKNNGIEYTSQKNSAFSFDTNTTFEVLASIENEKTGVQKEIEFTISDIPNYKTVDGKSYSFYEYFSTFHCDGKEKDGIDIEITYEEIVETFYDVIYDVDGDKITYADDINYKEGDKVIVEDFVPVKEGYKFTGWKCENDGKVYEANDELVMGTEQIVFVAQFAKTYTVTHKVIDISKNLSVVYETSETVVEGEDATLCNYVAEEGFKFTGWFIGEGDERKALEESDLINITSDLEIKGVISPVYKVTYYVDGELYYKDPTDYLYGTSVEEIKEQPVKEGHTFSGWYIGEKALEKSDLEYIKENIDVKGCFTTNDYTVTYYVDGVKYKTDENKYKYGTAFGEANFISKPEKEGYTFSEKWTITEGVTDGKVTGNVKIEGKFELNQYTITYYLDGEKYPTDANNKKYAYGTEFGQKDVIDKLEKEGYKFVGWNVTEGVSTEGKVIGNIKVEGTFEAEKYTVTYLLNEEQYENIDTAKYGDKLTLRDDIVKTGYKFSGWKVTKGINKEDGTVVGDVEVKGTLEKETYTVTYYVDGVEYATDEKKYEYEATFGEANFISKPEKEGYTFSEKWTITEGVTDGKVTGNVKVEGKFTINTYTVTHYINGVQYLETYKVNYGTTIDSFYSYECGTGYTFSGWDVTEGLDKNGKVVGNVVIKGTVTVNKYTVKFVNWDGEVIEEKEYEYSNNATALKPANDPTKADKKTEGSEIAAEWFKYEFKAWSPEGKYELDDISFVDCDMTFKATYTEKKVNVRFFVLKPGLPQPSEIVSYPTANYTGAMSGSIHYFKKIANNDEEVAKNIFAAPSREEIKKALADVNYTLLDDQEIRWYVVKEEKDGWHIDGIITNQRYDLTINYVDEEGNKLAESYTAKVTEGTKYSVDSPVIVTDDKNYENDYKLVNSEDENVSGIMPSEDLVIDVVYTKIAYHTVTYKVNGETVSTEVVADGGNADKCTYDIPEGYNFSGWFVEGDAPVSERALDEAAHTELLTNVTKDITIVGAISLKTFEINYYVKGGDYGKEFTEYDKYVVNYGESHEMLEDLNVEGYDFSGWDVVQKGASLTKVIMNIDIEGTLTKQVFTVTYIIDGETEEVVEGVEYGTSHKILSLDEIGYELEEGKNITELTPMNGDVNNVTEDIVIAATTSGKVFTVTYIIDGETVKIVENVPYGAVYTALDIKDLENSEDYKLEEGYTFSEFELTKGDITSVKEDIELTGTTSIKTFDITYYVDNNWYGKVTVNYGTKVESLMNYAGCPTGYYFGGWDKKVESEELVFVDDNVDINGYTFRNTYTVKFVDEDGTVLAEGVYEFEENAVEVKPADPEKDAVIDLESDPKTSTTFQFDKWNAEGEYTLTDLLSVEQDMTFVASYTSETTDLYADYDLTINYVDKAGNKLAESYTATIKETKEYSVESPVVEKYSFVNSVDATVEGTMPAENVVIDVVYETFVYNVRYYIDGEELLAARYVNNGARGQIISSYPALNFEAYELDEEDYRFVYDTLGEGLVLGATKAPVEQGLLKSFSLMRSTVTVELPIIEVHYETIPEETTTEEPTTEEPTTEEPTTEEPTTEEPTTEEPTTEEPTTEEPTTEEPTTEEPTTEEPTTEEPTTEEPTTVAKYSLTIKYVDKTGMELATAYVAELEAGQDYDVTSLEVSRVLSKA